MHDEPLFPDNTTLGDRYTVKRLLGRGSFGRTYLAHDEMRDGLVALKLLDSRGAGDWKVRELFEREASVLRALRHHGIPEIYDATEVEWQGHRLPVLSMEYIDGPSLSDIIESRRSQDFSDALRLLLDVLSVLEYLHGRVPPVLHRDIKPANIIVRTNGSPVLVDFGSVRQIFRSGDESGSTIAGTYGYMPYEQYMGQATPASDLFALAATFLHLLTGRPPKDFMDGHGRIALPSDFPGSPALHAVLARLLRTSPQERFASARDVRVALLTPGLTAESDEYDVFLGDNAEDTREPERPPVVSRRTLPKGVKRELPAPLNEKIPWPEDISSPTTSSYLSLETPTREQLTKAAQRARLDKLAPSMWDFMDTSSKPTDRGSVGNWLAFIAISCATLGVFPLAFFGIARARRRRLRRFLNGGSPAVARIHRIDSEQTAFTERVARVHYEFEADGQLHRDSDQVLPLQAARWELNQYVSILYIADDPYDSVVIGEA